MNKLRVMILYPEFEDLGICRCHRGTHVREHAYVSEKGVIDFDWDTGDGRENESDGPRSNQLYNVRNMVWKGKSYKGAVLCFEQHEDRSS